LTPCTQRSELLAIISSNTISTHFTVHCYALTSILKSSLAVSWQRIHNSHCVNHIKSLLFEAEFFSCYFFSVTFDCHLQNSTKFSTTPQINSASAELFKLMTTIVCSLETFLYIASGRTRLKTRCSIVPYCFRRVY
jgi:hypothetical protein